jgi:alanyl-tRNA synthetase
VFHVTDVPLTLGQTVHGSVDFGVRFDHMQQHSGEHLLSGLVFSRFGYENVGFHMNDRLVTVDYSGEITEEQLCELEKECEKAVLLDLPIPQSWPDEQELKKTVYRSKTELSGDVRLVKTGDWDVCACCGTHVRSTGEIGGIRLLAVSRYKGGSRVEMICGCRISAGHRTLFEQNAAVCRLLSAKPDKTVEAVESLLNEHAREKKRADELWREYCSLMAKASDEEQKVFFVRGACSDQLRTLCLALSPSRGGCAVFCEDAGVFRYAIDFPEQPDLFKKMNAALSGRGGGKDGFAQGAVQCSRQEIEEFFNRL